MNYEELILARQEEEIDECSTCPHRGKCANQCNEVTEVYNPIIIRMLEGGNK